MPAKPKYNRDTFLRICDGIADGKSLRTITNDPDMPNKATVFNWLGDEGHEDSVWMHDQYARAYSQRADAEYEDIADIEQRVISGDLDPKAAKVAIWSMQWRMGKAKPKKYGDKITHDHDGKIEVNVVDFKYKDGK